jgi:23S rRNA pseudouridine2605 synthase
MASERLQKAIARSGLCSRRAAEDLIARGKVTVNGVVATLGDKVDVSSDRVEVRGVPLPVAPGLVHYLVNKPVGVVSTTADTHGRRTVVDLVPADPPVHPVGRLDLDSGGLLILTNDGDLTLRLTHPRHGVEKVYAVRVRGRVTDGAVRRLERGVELEDGPARALRARVLDRRDDASLLEVTMGEGRNREVRRMCAAIGHEVDTLFRTKIGPIADASLGEGEWRPLTLDEVRALFDAAGSD